MNKLLISVLFVFALSNITDNATTSPTVFPSSMTEERIKYIQQKEFEERHSRKYDVLNHFKVKLENEMLIFDKIDHIAKRLDVDPEWILLSICRESRANPKAINPFSNATGIIQWLPSTAIDLGTTVDKIYNMSFYEQLDLVEKYILRTGLIKYINSYEDFYLAIFYPRAVGKSDDYIIGKKNSLVVKYNYPLSNDGIITVRDFKNYAKVII